MNPTEIDNAAFWDQLICLECDSVLEASDESLQRDGTCPHCGSDAVYSAVFIQRVLEWAGE